MNFARERPASDKDSHRMRERLRGRIRTPTPVGIRPSDIPIIPQAR